MHDALQVDFACQFSFSRFVPDALPPATMPRFSQPARSYRYMCQATQRLRPAVANGAHAPMAQVPHLAMEQPGHAQVPSFPLPLFGARPEQGSGQQKSATKPHQN